MCYTIEFQQFATKETHEVYCLSFLQGMSLKVTFWTKIQKGVKKGQKFH